MGRMVYWMNVTMDLRIEHAPNEQGGFTWMRIFGGKGAMDQLAQLRLETDGDIGVGGATVATELLRRGLLDELLLFVHPAVLGSGRPLFDEGNGVVSCDLVEHATFPDGVVMHRYTIRR